MKLDQLHQAFIAGIYGFESDLPVASFIKAGEQLSPEECLAVYRGSVLGNLSSALADIYPAFVRCVGDQFFQALALRYVKSHPSTSASLDHYGAEFPDYVSNFEPLKPLPYVEDLATLEWAWHLAFHAKDEQALEPLRLTELDEDSYEDLVFLLPDSACLISSDYPIKDIREKCLQVSDVSEDEAAGQVLDLSIGAQKLMVWRSAHYNIRIDSLSSLEYRLLSLINKKKNLGTILSDLQSNYPLEEINQILALALQRGWFVGFTQTK